MSIVEVKDLSKSFGEIKAVDQLSFSVNKGDIYGLLGVNGSGKSTTLRMLLTLISPDKGEILFAGESLRKNQLPIKKKLGALIERPDFYNYLTAYKNLEILMRYSGIKPERNRILEVLEIVGLQKFWNKNVGIFSQGMKQRLGIAQAMVHDPELIILDEPANGLDPHGLIDIRNLILELNKELGKTIILSSHILKEVEMIANRMMVIHEGRCIREGDVQELLISYDSKVKILVSDASLALQILKKMDLVTDREKETHKVYICKISEDRIPEINRYLVHKNIDIYGIYPVKNLEEYFVSLV
jgi:ABC-2 type transport system ATP-binding protein